MIAIPLLALLLIGSPQDSSSNSSSTPPSASTVAPRLTPGQAQQVKQKAEQAPLSREPERQEAAYINELAANIRSEADARKLVHAIAAQLTHRQYLLWAKRSIRRRVAHAEYQAVSDPSQLISEQRVVDIWNEYVREIDAPQEALVTVPEFHSLRSAQFATALRLWQREQSIWTMPNLYAVNSSGQLAEGCRALEAIRLLYLMHGTFSNVTIARERVQRGVSAPAAANQPAPARRGTTAAVPLGPKGPQEKSSPPMPAGPRARGRLASGRVVAAVAAVQDPIRPAAYRYQREHGEEQYDQLVRRMFDELLPPSQ